MLQTISLKSVSSSELSFPGEIQREEIADKLLAGIERIDAIAIELRNKTRDVDWDTYKSITIRRIVNSTNWNSLYRSIDNLHYGILNRHSYLVIDKSIRRNVTNYAKWPKLELGYTWPKVSFFSTINYKSIEKINNHKVEDIFENFFNFYCNDVHQSGCLRFFSSYMKSGYFFLGAEDQLRVSYTDGSSEVFDKKDKVKRNQKSSINCSEVYSSLSLNLIYDGSQSCLFETPDAFVLKILNFGNWGTNYDDIYCEHPTEQGMCFDINTIKKITYSSSKKTLIIDLQNNKGGTENTPWIAALTRRGFKDNLVMYKNLHLLLQPDVRSSAFYHSERAEKWYQILKGKVSNNVDEYGDFLPIRADFCRGSKECGIRTIRSSTTPIQYKNLKLVINEGCVSSCDDFIWRTRRYANAETYGQLPATDGTYARLNGYLFMNKQGIITSIFTGEGSEPLGDNGTLLVTYQIPISKTVNADGESLEGDNKILDFPLPIDKQNFSNLDIENLKRTLRY
jgi:hypothetical protein